MMSVLGGLWAGFVQILGFWMEHLLFINIFLSIVIVFLNAGNHGPYGPGFFCCILYLFWESFFIL